VSHSVTGRARVARALLIVVLVVFFVVRYAIQQYYRKDGRIGALAVTSPWSRWVS
jgi:hypothetical protein